MKTILAIIVVLTVAMVLSIFATVIFDNSLFVIIAFGCFVGMILSCVIWNYIDTRKYRYSDQDLCGPEDIV